MAACFMILLAIILCLQTLSAKSFSHSPTTPVFRHLSETTFAAYSSIHTSLKSSVASSNRSHGNNDRLVAVTSRRDVLLSTIIAPGTLAASSVLFPKGATAAEEQMEATKINKAKKPFAPKEALVPAVRVKMTIDRAIVLTQSLIEQQNKDTISIPSTLRNLEELILKPQNYTSVQNLTLQGVPAKPSELYLDSYKPMRGDLPFQRILIQNGDVQTWKALKQREKQQESTNEVRAALNAYTDALSFSSDSYLLNVDKATRSSMVREDRLPDVKQVITSDMGMRYLYRNQILTALDDVGAELQYQLSVLREYEEKGSDLNVVDGGDLMDLLLVAQKACDRWFDLIDPNDVQEAFNMVVQ